MMRLSIRRRLALSMVTILLLFAVNQGIYSWSANLRNKTLKALQQAMQRQVQTALIRQQVDRLHNQVAVFSQLQGEGGGAEVDADSRREMATKLGEVRQEIQTLEKMTSAEDSENVKQLEATFAQLAGEWQGYYDSLGVRQTEALGHLVKADPLSQRLLTDILPKQARQEQERVRTATQTSDEESWQTNVLSFSIFLISMVVAVVLTYQVSSHMDHGLTALEAGAALIGGGHLGHRVELDYSDELGHLAQTFNGMAEHLLSAREDLVQSTQLLEAKKSETEKQKEVSENLLRNILPPQIAIELQTKGVVDPKYFEDVTIVFTDFVGFTASTENLAAEDLVYALNDYFTAFDEIATRYHMEKLKTIGDSYMCACGMPVDRRKRRNPSHPVDAVLTAFEMVESVKKRDYAGAPVRWSVRIGVHTGPVMAGVVGIQKFAFDIWGDTVNFASRMETASSPNCVNISERTYSRVKDFFECEHRGKVLTKDKKEVDMYFVRGILPALMQDRSEMPPPQFVRRYQIYFQKNPPDFPVFLVHPEERAAGAVASFPVAGD